jgi:hypothetical protein
VWVHQTYIKILRLKGSKKKVSYTIYKNIVTREIEREEVILMIETEDIEEVHLIEEREVIQEIEKIKNIRKVIPEVEVEAEVILLYIFNRRLKKG